MQQNILKPFKFDRPIRLYILSDLHIGEETHNEKYLNEVIDTIRNDKDGYVFFNGDQLETITPACGIDKRSQLEEIDDQVRIFRSILKRLKGKVLFARAGNHERRVLKAAGTDLMLRFEDMVKTEIKGTTLHRFIIKNTMYNIVSSHGSKIAASAQFKRMSDWMVGADAYIMGHNHVLSVQETTTVKHDVRYEEGNNTRKIHWIQAGTFIGHADYAQNLDLPPNPNGYVILHMSEKKMFVTTEHCEIRSKLLVR